MARPCHASSLPATPSDGRGWRASPAVGSAGPSVGPTVELCDRIETVQSRLADLSALELRPTARVTLDIELSRVQAAFSDMRQDALDARDLTSAIPSAVSATASTTWPSLSRISARPHVLATR